MTERKLGESKLWCFLNTSLAVNMCVCVAGKKDRAMRDHKFKNN